MLSPILADLRVNVKSWGLSIFYLLLRLLPFFEKLLLYFCRLGVSLERMHVLRHAEIVLRAPKYFLLVLEIVLVVEVFVHELESLVGRPGWLWLAAAHC